MGPFAAILEEAEFQAGGPDALEAQLPQPKSGDALRSMGDDRYLSIMSQRIFRAGLKHSMVDARWPAFEAVFFDFEPGRVQQMSDEALEALLSDKRLIRHWGKIKSVRANATVIHEIAAEKGNFGTYLADWPTERIVDLWADLAKRCLQLGGNSAPYFLRMVGKDTFILTKDVVRALNRWRAFDGEPKRKADQSTVQTAFNHWAREANRPLCQLSLILALSVG